MTPDERAADAIALVAKIRARLAALKTIEYEPDPDNVTDADEE